MSDSEWVECLSKKHDKIYWFNKSTGKSAWIKPVEISDEHTNKKLKQTNINYIIEHKINNQSYEYIEEILNKETKLIQVNAPNCPRLISSIDIPYLINILKTEKPLIVKGDNKQNPDVDIIFTLGDIDTSQITRAYQEDQMLNTRLKLKKKNDVIDLPSFWDVWFNNNELSKDIINSNDSNEAKWKLQMKYNYKLATNFIPGYAKAIYEHFNATTVLDPCAGWGDRLVGAIAAVNPNVKKYVAFDPNTTLRPGYAQIMKSFGVPLDFINDEKLIFSNGYTIFSLPFEVGSLQLESNSFDLVFTSPPFFDYEMYSPNNPKYIDWISQFYIPLMQQSYRCVRPGGHVAIYVGDTSAGEIDQFMRDDVIKITKLQHRKKIAFRGMSSNKIRGIWVYQKPDN